jgi:hypothetical protein
MAQKMQVLLTCDLESGEKPASQTIRFTVDGTAYEIDLCDKHAKQLRDGMATFTAAGRRVSTRGGAGRRGRATASADRQRTQDIRAWARKEGIAVSERGRLSGDVVAQYEARGGK